MTLPRVLCRGWRSSTGALFPCLSPVMQPGETGGRLVHDAQCARCAALQKSGDDARWAREGKKLLRDRAKGYGPQKGDPFKGFKEGDK